MFPPAKRVCGPSAGLPAFPVGGGPAKPSSAQCILDWPVVGWGFCSFLGLFYAVSSSPHDFVFTASDDLLTCSKKLAVKVSFVFVVWKETCKLGWPGCSITL